MAECKKDDSDKIFAKFDNFGLFQVYQYFLVVFPLVVVSMMNVNYIFVASETNYRCKVPVCDDENSTVERPQWWPQDLDDKCTRPVFSFSDNKTCTNTTIVTEIQECDKWIYENENSIVSELNLACEPWKANLVGTFHNAGMIFSMFLMGWISDRFGRKPSVIICSVGGVVGLAKLVTKNYYAYLAIEAIESIISSGLYTVGIVLMIEVGGSSQRVLAGVIFSGACYVGEVLFAFIAIAVPYWKHLILIAYTPVLIFLFTGIFIRESMRWQIVKGLVQEAKNSLILVARMNKIDLSPDTINNTSNEVLRSKMSIQKQEKTENLKDILSSKKIMVRLAVTSFCLFTSGFVYYGLLVQSVLLPGNKYYIFALASLTSFPGDLLAYYSFNRFGRRVSLQGGFFASAIFLTIQALTPDSLPWLNILLFLGGKLAAALCFTGLFTYSLELFPTSVRATLIGFGNTAARVGSMLSPLTPLLGMQVKILPSVLFASASVISGLLLLLTPETKNLPLLDTIAQVENYENKVINQNVQAENNTKF